MHPPSKWGNLCSSLPARYYANNVGNTIHLIEAMIEHGVQRLIFSSTAAIFGDPIRIPIDEAHPRQPVNPYGWSKSMVEQILADCDCAHSLNYVIGAGITVADHVELPVQGRVISGQTGDGREYSFMVLARF